MWLLTVPYTDLFRKPVAYPVIDIGVILYRNFCCMAQRAGVYRRCRYFGNDGRSGVESDSFVNLRVAGSNPAGMQIP
jgi:hypothetical protein